MDRTSVAVEGQEAESDQAWAIRNAANRDNAWKTYLIDRTPTDDKNAQALAYLRDMCEDKTYREMMIGVDDTWYPADKFRYVWSELEKKHHGKTSYDLAKTMKERDE
jgi:hypothetical protein